MRGGERRKKREEKGCGELLSVYRGDPHLIWKDFRHGSSINQ